MGSFERHLLAEVGKEVKEKFPKLNLRKDVGVMHTFGNHFTVEVVLNGTRQEFYVVANSKTEARAKGFEALLK